MPDNYTSNCVSGQGEAAGNSGEDRPPRPVATYTTGWTDRIPDELKRRRQWVVWRFEFRPGKKKGGKPWTKTPYRAKPPRLGSRRRSKAQSNNPQTWATFAEALAAYQANAGRDDDERLDGIGYVFSPDDDYLGVDFDDCLGPDGEI